MLLEKIAFRYRPAVAHVLTLRSSLQAMLALAALHFLVLVLSFHDAPSWRTVYAQTSRPVIHSVHPEPPYCVLHDSPYESDRRLTLTGENLTVAGGDGRVEFLEVATETVTGPVSQDLNWLDPRRITVDMGRIGEHWPLGQRIVLRVRITSTDSSEPLSNWSDAFVLADASGTCAYLQPFTPPPPIRGIAGDHWADVVIGKPDFAQIVNSRVVPYKVFNPGGVLVDRSVDPGRAYVWDSGNSRILAIDLAVCYSSPEPCSADFVLGQPSSYDHSACNGDSGVQDYPKRASAGPDTLCGIPDHSLSPEESHTFVTMAVDNEGALYVPDSFNHRVLKYENPFETDSIADQVWGQEDFSGILCNWGDFDKPTAESLCFHSATNLFMSNWYGNGVEIDSQGNMWVADGGNNRVLRFSADQLSGEISNTPDLVLGQVDFTSAKPGNALDRLHAPSALRFDQNGILYVADTVNDRVLAFEPPFESGMSADRTFGSKFHRPTSVEIDPDGRGVWVLDAGNSMVELWDVTGTSVLRVLGKDSYQPTRECGSPRWELPGSPHMCPIAGSLGIDAQGSVLVPVFLGTADVFRFSVDDNRRQVDGPRIGLADLRLFHPPIGTNYKDRSGMQSARGVAAVNDQLIVSDHDRLMFWNGLSTLENGQPADGVVGEEFFVPDSTDCCGRIKADASGRLWVLGMEGFGYLDVYVLPLTEYAVPIHTIWKNEVTFAVLGTEGHITLGGRIFGLAPVGNGEHLWISDTDNHRVLRIRDPLTDPVVDVILGQLDANGRQCNQGRFPSADRTAIESGLHDDVLCFPGALSIDRLGNLYVSDHSLEIDGNRRLLIFSAESTPLTNTETIFGPSASKVFIRSAIGPTNLWADPWEPGEVFGQHTSSFWGSGFSAATWEPAFDSANRMVVGYNAYLGPRFVGIYDDPLGPEELPTSFLHDFGSMPYTATFDENDNLYVGDINRARVLVYRNPFNNVPEPAEQQTIEAPLPEYPVTFESVDPEPPSCLVRNSPRTDERTLNLMVEGLADRQDLTLEFRKVTSRHREFLDIGPQQISNNGASITVSDIGVWRRLWGHLDRVVLTVRILERGHPGTPVSNWSPASVLVNDANDCGIETSQALGPPTISAVTPNAGFLTVSWNTPEDKGGSNIVSYDLRHVTTAADGTLDSNWTVVETIWSATDGGELEYDLTGLAVGTRYDVQVRAVDTTGPGPWSVTFTGTPRPPSVCFTGGAVADVTNTGLISDCEALLASRDTLAGDATLNWSVNVPIEDWDGITIQGTPERVAWLNIREGGLNGSISPELGRLSNLTYLNLRNNGLAGPIPSEFGNLTNLRYLGLNNNELTGPIPDLSRLTHLEQLYLSNNDLTGVLPDWMGTLTNVRELWLWGNELEGTIPDLRGMTGLVRIKLQTNNFTGGIPTWFGDMTDLVYLYLHRNMLSGSIPKEIGGLERLERLWLSENELTGKIPDELDELSLKQWRLADNQLTGCVPAGLVEVEDTDFNSLGLQVCTDL